MTTRLTLLTLALTTLSSFGFGQNQPILARNPSLGADRIVFEYGTDLWSVPRSGGQAHRLTSGPGVEAHPHISPDGKWVAFTGNYDGNMDVYVMPVTGGQPRRLTFHPAPDTVVGWTPDGKSVIFASAMNHSKAQNRLYTVPATGGWPEPLPLPRGLTGSYSPDGTRIAYIPHDLWQPSWKHYKGGQTTPIWIARLADSKIEKIPRVNSNDRNPMWVNNKVFFLSDRDGRWTLYSYDTEAKSVNRRLAPGAWDVKSADAGPGGIVLERMGALSIYDFDSGRETPVPITVEDDLIERRTTFRSVGNEIRSFHLSPGGVRAVFEAHGEIFTVPAEKGDARNLTQTPGVAERSPIWSPDGKKIAYLSDADGNYKLHVVDQMGGGKPEIYTLSERPNWYHSLAWSPDGSRMVYVDQNLDMYLLDLASHQSKKIDREPYYTFGDKLDPSWSPDSKWIAYTKRLSNKLAAVFVHSVSSGKSTQLTDGLSDTGSAVFDVGGKYLYFLASTDIAETISTGGMSSMGHTASYTPYLVVLNSADPTPFAPESDEEGTPPPNRNPRLPLPGLPPSTPPAQTPPSNVPPAGQATAPPTTPAAANPTAATTNAGPDVKIDFDGIGQRILSLPMPAGPYDAVAGGSPGSVFVIRGPSAGSPPGIIKFTLASRQMMPFAQGASAILVTPRGDKAMIAGAGGFQIVSTMAPVQPGQGMVRTDGMQTRVDPPSEWRQMFYEIWRNDRDFFYDPNLHGLDIAKVEARYRPFLDRLASRQDFNYMVDDMLNEVSVGHTFSGGGDVPTGAFVPGGLLGADYSIENGRYRFKRVYSGENWNPGLRAPLTQPGGQVKAGEYLLSVDGKDLTSKDNIYERFENTANRQIRITVGPNANGTGSRTFVVVPVASENALRSRAWVEDNRRAVEQLSGGRISYVYMPDTSGSGFQSFNRYFTAQLGRDAVLMDDRYNQGGALSDYVVQILNRQVLAYAHQRDNEDFAIPIFSNEGPKAMLINEMAGSGGDALPWFFRTGKTGPLFGTRTWGGLVAASQGVPLMGGGFHTSPQVAIYGLNGEWEVENHGVAPDTEVEEDPYLWRQGRDPQLESAVKYLMDQLAKNPPKKVKRPAYPNYHQNDGLGHGGPR